MFNITKFVSDRVRQEFEALLWFDSQGENVHVTLTISGELNDTLRNLSLALGATDELLKTRCFVVCGPTAVGKTKFINRLKQNMGAEVINMDTMQIYDVISYGTGRTDVAEENMSYIYGTYDPNRKFHVLDYLVDVFAAIKKIKSNGHPVVFEGSSLSLLSVIMHVFSNLTIFGIQAIDNRNIQSNIEKRITAKAFVEPLILELSTALKEKRISFHSEVLKQVVYAPVLNAFAENVLLGEHLQSDIEKGRYRAKIDALTKKLVRDNISLHKRNLSLLKAIQGIRWFNNDEKSVDLLEMAFREKLRDSSILVPTADFDFIDTGRCSGKRTPSNEVLEKVCKKMDGWVYSGDMKSSMIVDAAKLNVPLLPNKDSKQLVIGTTKHLLPYALLPGYFNTFAVNQDAVDANELLVCFASKFIKNDIIRIVTTPLELVDVTKNYRITAREICIIKKHGYRFYKYDSFEFTNVYFCSRFKLNRCALINTSRNGFKCKKEDLITDLYF